MKLLLTVCCAMLVVVNLSFAESSDQQTAANVELLKEMKALEAKVASLEKRLERYENGDVRSEKTAAASRTKSSDKAIVSPDENNTVATAEEITSSPGQAAFRTWLSQSCCFEHRRLWRIEVRWPGSAGGMEGRI